MVNIQVVPAHPSNKKGGKLTHFAIDEMAKVILGETSKNRINCQLQKLWKKEVIDLAMIFLM